jgi:hypothetical protein
MFDLKRLELQSDAPNLPKAPLVAFREQWIRLEMEFVRSSTS